MSKKLVNIILALSLTVFSSGIFLLVTCGFGTTLLSVYSPSEYAIAIDLLAKWSFIGITLAGFGSLGLLLILILCVED